MVGGRAEVGTQEKCHHQIKDNFVLFVGPDLTYALCGYNFRSPDHEPWDRDTFNQDFLSCDRQTCIQQKPFFLTMS
jgi:hypothetical protein